MYLHTRFSQTDLICFQRERLNCYIQRIIAETGFSNFLLCSVGFNSLHKFTGKRQSGRLSSLTGYIIYTYHIFISIDRFLQCLDYHVRIVRRYHRESTSHFTFMLICLEGFQCLVQHLCLRYHFSLVKLTLVRKQAVSKCVITKVLSVLISISLVSLGRMEQSKTERIVRRFIPSVFSVIHNRNSIVPLAVGQISPVMSVNLICCHCIISTLHTTQRQVISSIRIRHSKREFRFQQRICRAPVYFIRGARVPSYRRTY